MTKVDENPLYGVISFQVSTHIGSASWVDITADVVSAQATSGNVPTVSGVGESAAGALVVQLLDFAGTVSVGNWIRIIKTGTTTTYWAGFVQDIDSESVWDYKNDRLDYTTLICYDWAGYIGQMTVADQKNTPLSGSSKIPYPAADRIRYLNNLVAPSTNMISVSGSDIDNTLGDSYEPASLVQALDATANSNISHIWYPTTASPTNGTTGRTGLIAYTDSGTAGLSNVLLSDGTHGSVPVGYTYIPYISIQNSQSSRDIVNTVSLSTDCRFDLPQTSYTVATNGTNTDSLLVGTNPLDNVRSADYTHTDSTSVTAYGPRQYSISTTVSPQHNVHYGSSTYKSDINLVWNPNAQTTGDYFNTEQQTNYKSARKQIAKNYVGLPTTYGDFVMRCNMTTAATDFFVTYRHTNGDDGIPVDGGLYYDFTVQAARWTTASTDTRGRAQIYWLDADGANISITSGSYTTLSTTVTWYKLRAAATAPANATSAYVRVNFNRVAGTNLPVGAKCMTTAYNFQLSDSTVPTTGAGAVKYFTGDTPPTSTALYVWEGAPYASNSHSYQNTLATLGQEITTANATATTSAKRVRINAQSNLAQIQNLGLYKAVKVCFNGTTQFRSIIAITHTIDAERWMIDFDLTK